MNTNTPNLTDLLNQFLESITDPNPANRPNSIEDPRFAAILNSQSLILQSKLAERFDTLSGDSPEDLSLPNRILRTLALMEKPGLASTSPNPRHPLSMQRQSVRKPTSTCKANSHKARAAQTTSSPRP